MTAWFSSPVIRLAAVLAASVCLSASQDRAPATATPQGPPSGPTFRAESNIVMVDVRVTDERGEFIRDLTQNEFQIFEDGREQAVSLFSLIDIPFVGPPPPVFAETRVERDVASNDSLEGRLYVMILDDAWGNASPIMSPAVQSVARDFVTNYLTDADRLALISTSGRKDMAQEFTNNRRRLLDAIDRYWGGFGQEISFPGSRVDPVAQMKRAGLGSNPRAAFFPGGGSDGDHTTMLSLTAVADWLSGVRGRRKAIVVITTRTGCFTYAASPTTQILSSQQKGDSSKLLEASAHGTVTIYAISPGVPARGFDDLFASSFDRLPFGGREFGLGLDGYDVDLGRTTNCTQGIGSVARDTGGFALPVSSPGLLARIVRESGSYYLLGYTSTDRRRDNRFRQIEVRTTRSGMKTVARSGYVATNPRTRRVTEWTGVPPTLTGVINSPLPTPGLTFRVAAPAFREKGSTASIGVVIEARANQLQFTEQGNRFNGAFTLFVVAADADGRAKDREFGTLTMRLLPDTHAAVTEYGARLATKLELKPGRYQLRIGALERSTTLRGGVYYDLDVPDFSKGPLNVSSIALISDREAHAPTAAPDERWKRFVGAPPTAQREFSRDDGLRKYVEVYDNSRKRGSIELTTQVRDQSGRIAFTDRQTSAAAKEKSPTYRFLTTIPLASLEPGQYLLTAEARSSAIDGRPALREVPFTVR